MESRSTASPATTADDFARRLDRAANEATEAGLAGLLATPGPDLFYLTGYAPADRTGGLTILAVQPGAQPTMMVPSSERLDAAGAVGAGALSIMHWADGTDPFVQFAPVLEPGGRYAISDSASAGQLFGLQRVRPHATFIPVSAALPSLRTTRDPGLT